jgi:hypothetical protein
MKLRDHPLLIYGGKSAWPPVWIEKYGVTELTGEIGILTHVGGHRPRWTSTIYLHITDHGRAYCGPLLIPDAPFRSAIYKLLRQHKGHTIKDIGDLDLSYTL